MFFSNQFADRNFASEKFLMVSHLVGGAAILGLGFLQRPLTFHLEPAGTSGDFVLVRDAASFPLFVGLMALHTLLYVPTITIANKVAFENLADRSKYGQLRLWGTIGWIAAAWPAIFFLDGPSRRRPARAVQDGRRVSRPPTASSTSRPAVAEILLGVFCLTLPHTPPKTNAGEKLAWVEALKLLRKPFVLVLFLVTFVDAAVHQSYFFWAFDFLKDGVRIPGNWIQPVMTVGQVAEILRWPCSGRC